MYNAHETITTETDRESDEKRKADDRKTKQKMELIRSKLKPNARKVKNFYRIIVCFNSYTNIFSGYSPKSSLISNKTIKNKCNSSSSSKYTRRFKFKFKYQW
jgi:hypothetical protein